MIKYYALIKVAELGSISKAAAALGYSQPGLSHILNSFEAKLGVKLFIRNMSGITLTEAGEDVLEYCKKMLAYENKINEIAASRDKLTSGTIRIGAFASALVSFIPKAIKYFSVEFPNIEIHIEEYQAENMVYDLQTGKIDIAFIASKEDYSDGNNIPVGYSYDTLLNDRICLLLNKNHPLANKEKIRFNQLKDCDLLVPSSAWNRILQVDLVNEHFKSNFKHIVKSDLALFSLVSNNVGVALVSNLEESIKFDNVLLKDFEEDTSRNIIACVSDFNKSVLAIKEFISTCKYVISEAGY